MNEIERKMDRSRKKFRGCMLGILLGDCLGAPFEGSFADIVNVQRYFDKLDDPHQITSYLRYTCNTALTKSIAICLTHKPHLDIKHLVNYLIKEFCNDSERGYSQELSAVLEELRRGEFTNVYDPARISDFITYGNAGIISVAPIALLFSNNHSAMFKNASRVIELTHAHKLTVRGALLYCLAIDQCLNLSPYEMADHTSYINGLIEKMKAIEEVKIWEIDDPTPFHTQLRKLTEMFAYELAGDEDYPVGCNEFLRGIGLTALHAIPSAIYCYLRAQRPIDDIRTDNPFRRSIQFAISCGGDTNSIAALVGSLAGAHYGDEIISKHLRKHCEYVKQMIKIGEDLHKLRVD